jgi:hypothetical protein
MQNVYLLRCEQGRYFGYNRKGVVFAFKTRRHAEYVKRHVKHYGDHVDKIVSNKYLLRTPYNCENSFVGCEEMKGGLERMRLYDLILSCNVNKVSLRIIIEVLDLDNGDLEMNVDEFKYKMPVDTEITRFNLEMLYKGFKEVI